MKSRTIGRTLTDPRKYEPLLAIRNEREYDAAVARLNELVDEVGDKPRDPRYRFIETLSVLIEAYDVKHYKIPDASGVELLKFLMDEHELSQGDLPEVGSQGVVSEILRGKRELNVRHIQALSRRFHLPAAAFFNSRPATLQGVQKWGAPGRELAMSDAWASG
jgi:HTH-type transcriptional regulator / antitoxin HigA